MKVIQPIYDDDNEEAMTESFFAVYGYYDEDKDAYYFFDCSYLLITPEGDDYEGSGTVRNCETIQKISTSNPDDATLHELSFGPTATFDSSIKTYNSGSLTFDISYTDGDFSLGLAFTLPSVSYSETTSDREIATTWTTKKLRSTVDYTDYTSDSSSNLSSWANFTYSVMKVKNFSNYLSTDFTFVFYNYAKFFRDGFLLDNSYPTNYTKKIFIYAYNPSGASTSGQDKTGRNNSSINTI